jgi:hypothetical protein
MSYTKPYQPQIYSYQSRSRFRQYPRQVVTPIPGAGYDVSHLDWREQAIDLGGMGGLGITTQQATNAIDVAVQLARDPDAYLRQNGPRIVAAAETYLLQPMVDSTARASAPYILKYALPAMTVLYVLAGMSAFYSYKAAKKVGAL